MRSKRKKVLLVLGVVAVATVFVVTLWPPDEPKYQGRYLSEWIATNSLIRYSLTYGGVRPSHPDFAKVKEREAETEAAIRAIGTDALPFLLKWMGYETPAWKYTLRARLPDWITYKFNLSGWLYDQGADQRAKYAARGFSVLGTNAASAIPELVKMINHPNREHTVLVFRALVDVGAPVGAWLEGVVTDPTNPSRHDVVDILGQLSDSGYTPEYYRVSIPILRKLLEDEDELIRKGATNGIGRVIAIFPPGFRGAPTNALKQLASPRGTNAPAQ